MSRLNVLSCQVHGTVDWITQDGREFGMYLRGSSNESARCVVRGREAERLIASGVVQKGMLATAFGELSARCMQRHDNGLWMAETLCTAARLVVETPRESRIRGAMNANLKGVVMHWDPNTLQLKTFFNPTPNGSQERFTCSLHMRPWVGGMSPEGQERFKAMMRTGREFTMSALVEASCYKNKEGEQVASLLLLPTDFRLQG